MESKINIIYEDSNILIINKPIKMLSHIENRNQLPDVLSVLRHPEYHVITRLDTNTTGLMLLAKTKEVASILSKWMRAGMIHKTYLALAVGYFANPEDTVEAYLLKDSENSVVRLSHMPIEGAEKIITKYKVLKEENQLSLVEIELITGKTHQIRSHLAMLKNPLLGDPLYGNKKMNQQYRQYVQCLVSYKLCFEANDHSTSLDYLFEKKFVLPKIPFIDIIEKK